MSVKSIAIYLPQFHPTPENDLAWGKGFTEWTNVTRAKPFFRRHYQPRLPADLGFYDLRLEHARVAQERLAKDYGISAFCYYHYWFDGKRLLHEPLDRKLKNQNEDLPFMLCWANETWSKRWLGEEKEVIIKQTYSEQDDRVHADWLAEKAFSDSRYFKIDGRPVFLIYRPNDLPDIRRTLNIITTACCRQGISKPYFIGCDSHAFPGDMFDNVLNFEPKLGLLPDAFEDGQTIGKLMRNLRFDVFSSKLKIYDYDTVKRIFANRSTSKYSLPCVMVGWDNTPRRGRNGIIITNQNRETFKKSLIDAKTKVLNNKPGEQLVFINAWNEWAEGNHLEPDRKFGHQFLQAVKEVFG